LDSSSAAISRAAAVDEVLAAALAERPYCATDGNIETPLIKEVLEEACIADAAAMQELLNPEP
jgi:hypothetical protein